MKSISAIYNGYNKKMTIAQLAKTAHLSRTAYIETFKKLMRTTPAKFILHYRIKKAKELLLKSELSVSEISMQTGFYNASHFDRSFTRLEGVTPVEYRNSN